MRAPLHLASYPDVVGGELTVAVTFERSDAPAGHDLNLSLESTGNLAGLFDADPTAVPRSVAFEIIDDWSLNPDRIFAFPKQVGT